MTKSTMTREPITHYLKIYPEFFSAVCTGVKRAELRKNDLDYRVGDTLHLMETPRGSCHQTGEFINVKITHIADVGEWIPGYVLLSIEREAMDRKASMDSEPVAYIFKHPSGKLFWALTDESNKGRRDVMPVYAAPLPAPVVSEDLYNLANHIASSKNGLPDEWQDWAEELESDIRRAAMFQAEPVTTANKLPPNSFTDDELEGMAHGDNPQSNAYRELLAYRRNSPVIPDGSEHCPCCGKKLRRACSVEGCEGKHVAHGLCKKHYDMKRWEDPEQVRKFREAGKRYRRKTKSAAAAPQEVNSWSSHHLPVTRGDAVGCPFNREEEP